MSSIIEADTSEDIADFLLRIRELGEKRDQEDAERTRKLEADVLQGRKERHARRGTRIIRIIIYCSSIYRVLAKANCLGRVRQINVSNEIFIPCKYSLFKPFALESPHAGWHYKIYFESRSIGGKSQHESRWFSFSFKRLSKP